MTHVTAHETSKETKLTGDLQTSRILEPTPILNTALKGSHGEVDMQ